MKITITGASDDLIEVDGDICEEFAISSEDAADGVVLAISDGTLLNVFYDDDGIWRITRAFMGSAAYSHQHGLRGVNGILGGDSHDVVTLEGEIRWVVMGSECATP